MPWQHIVKGYELSKTQVVTLTQEELRAADPERDRTIGIEEFVKLEEIDPLQLDQSYYVAPEGRSAKAYALLAEALEKAEQVAIARIVLSTKQHLCMVRSAEGRLVLTTLVWADEVREAPEVPRTGVGGKELQMAEQLVRSMSGKFAALPVQGRAPRTGGGTHPEEGEGEAHRGAGGAAAGAGWWTSPARSRRASPPRGRLRPVRRPGPVLPAPVAGPRPPGPAPAVARSPGSAQRKSEHEA